MVAQAFGLLSTKLNRPPVTADWVDRPRLIEQLNHSLQHGSLTLVCASAGFGKTTLVSSWIESLAASERPPIPAAWLSLDESDSDLVVFLRYFVAAIRTVFPESCTETLALLQASQPVSQTLLVIALTDDIAQLPSRSVLVLDDYYTVNDEAVYDFLSALLRHWPQRLHLVLISRSNPALPLAKLRASGDVTEIRSRDLRFSPAESAEFLRKVLPVPPSQSALDLLHERLEGWIAGLRLVTLSLGAGANAEQDLAAFSGTHFEIADYLLDEVMANQPPDILRFLLATSILDRFCTPLCEYVLGSATGRDGSACDVPACIQWLERHNLFVIPLDDHRQWHRYHHLFQELLQRRLLDVAGPEQVSDLHRRAAAWLKGQGLIDEAIRHALAINDLGLAAELMAAGMCDVLNREDRATLDRWLRLLPEDFVQRHPWLLMIKTVVLGFSWQLAASFKLLSRIEALLDQEDQQARRHVRASRRPGEATLHAGDSNVSVTTVSVTTVSVTSVSVTSVTVTSVSVTQDVPVLRGMIATLRCQEAYLQGQEDRAIAYAEDALALLPKQWSYVRGVAIQYWGLNMQATGRGDSARSRLIDEYASLLGKTDAYALKLLFTVCFNAIEAGELEQAGRFAQAMLDDATSRRLPHAVGYAHLFLGVVHYCRNELDAAGQHFGELVAMRLSAHTQGARNGMVGLTRVHVARGEMSAAWSVMELLTQFDLERMGHAGEDTRSLRAQLQYLQDDTEPAFCWADGYTTPALGRSLLWLQNPHLAKAQILLARGAAADVEPALEILDVLLGWAQETFNTRCQIDALALRALALEKQGKDADALAALRQAVELARPGRSVRPFIDLGSPMRTMLLRLAGRGFAVETIRRIVAAFPGLSQQTETSDFASESRAANAALVEPLSRREIEVLMLLREHLTNPEIAKQLCLSTTTVKRHTVNLYGKLGVNSRRDAVVKAESLKILPPR